MKLRPNLPETEYKTFRGHGEKSIPFTGGDPQSPFYARPARAAFFTKADLIDHPKVQYERGRMFLGRLDQNMIGIADNRHIVTLAGSGGGKSVCSLIPNLMLYEGSALVLDPKGELAAATAMHRAETMGQAVFVLDPFGISGDDCAPYRRAFDPLAELADDRAHLIENADLVADAMIIPSGKDPFWTDSARSLLRALILWLVLDPDKSGGSLADIPALIARISREVEDEARKKAPSLLDTLAALDLGDVPENEADAWAVIKQEAAMVLGLDGKTRSNVLSTARSQLVFLDSPAMARAVASSSFALADMKRAPCTVYLCLPAARMGTHSRWLRLIVNLAIAALEQERTRPELPTLVILEEMAALGPMKTLENAVAYMRGFGVKLWAVLQDITQLQRDYPKSWETFLGNAGILQAYSLNDQTTLNYLSKRMGETTLQITNKQDVSSSASAGGDSGLRREFKQMALMTPDEIGVKFAHKVADDGTALGGLSLVLWSGKAPMMIERVYYKELQPVGACERGFLSERV